MGREGKKRDGREEEESGGDGRPTDFELVTGLFFGYFENSLVEVFYFIIISRYFFEVFRTSLFIVLLC